MKQVLDYVQKYQLITDGDRVVVGLSGGADSVCLLFVLRELQVSIDFSICAVHINHNLRGQEALRDEAYVKNLCKKLQIPLKIVSAEVSQVAKQEKIGVEEAGRRVRYEAFERYAKDVGGTRIALAHHQNDVAETMIYHLARGTDLAGLAAIRPMRGNYIRPLLCMNRQDIEHYLKSRNIEYVTDSTNLEDHYMRNRIRHHVVEYLEQEINEQAAVHMSETAESLGDLYDYLIKEADQKLSNYSRFENDGIYLDQAVFKEPKVLIGYVIRAAVKKQAGGLKDITREHLLMIQNLVAKAVGKKVNLPNGLIAQKEYSGIWIGKAKTLSDMKTLDSAGIDVPIPGEISWNGYEIICTLKPASQQEIPEKTYTKWLDYDTIKSNLVLRFRKPGDYIIVNGQGGKKKIKDYFIDLKVPQKQRDQVPLLCCGSEVLWVYGYRISEAYKVKKETQKILKIRIRGGICHE